MQKRKYHPAFLQLFSYEALEKIFRRCVLYTVDDAGRIEMMLILSDTLNVQMECRNDGAAVYIEDLDSANAIDPGTLLQRLASVTDSEADIIVVD